MSTYVFDNAWELERERLGGLESVLDPGTTRHLAAIGVGPGWACLEVGGGGGSITEWMCRRVGRTGTVVATDLDTRFLDALDEPNLEVLRHDILADELPESTFDLIHSRLVLEHLPARESVLERMKAALKPGGWVLIEDLDWRGYFSTPPQVYWYPADDQELTVRVWGAVVRVMEGAGYDHAFGCRLPDVLSRLGFGEVAAEARIAMYRGGTPGSAAPRFTLQHLREGILATGITPDELDREVERFTDPKRYGGPTMVAAWGCRADAGEAPKSGAMTASTNGTAARLRNMPLFAACTIDEVRAIGSLGHEVVAAAGEEVTREGEPGDAFYVIVTGTATVQAQGNKLAALGPGSFFGETALLTDGRRTATVTAESPMRLLALKKEAFDIALRESPALARAILEGVAERTAGASRMMWP
jgi:SAM-dependent methyltransferase